MEKQRTHERIVEIAARRLREEGLNGVGVADLMKEAGLTVGGFYKHFASRDELVAEAMQSAFSEWERRLAEEGVMLADLTMEDYMDAYLGTGHRDDPGSGCAFAALNGELARSDPKTREIATERVRRNIDVMAMRMPDADAAAARRKAILAVCAMAGAVGFARVVDDPVLSEDILQSVNAALRDITADKV
jgi:TetR/AcrR family transcriptional repressor of nem operon